MIQLRHCEALYAADRTREAAESLPNIIKSIGEDVSMREHITILAICEFCSTCSSVTH